jgi:hypothetical protein
MTAAVLAIAVLVGAFLAYNSFNHQLPDITPGSRPALGGGTETASSYLDFKIHVTLQNQLVLGQVFGLQMAAGGFRLEAHEVMAKANGPATVFSIGGLTTAATECKMRSTLYYANPDYSGKADSNEVDFTVGTEALLQFGHMNMYRQGEISLTFDIAVKGCIVINGQTLYSDWTVLPSAKTGPIKFQFDGVDNFK